MAVSTPPVSLIRSAVGFAASAMVLKAGDKGPVTDVTIPTFKVSAPPVTTGSINSIGSKKKTLRNEILFIIALLNIYG